MLSQYQPEYDISVSLNYLEKSLAVEQVISFKNTAEKPLDTLYLTDWSNAYSSIKTPLAQRFGEEYDRSFYLSKKTKLGFTELNSVTNRKEELSWNRLENQQDIIRVIPKKPIAIGEEYELNLVYYIKIADHKFNRYGYDQQGNIILRNWYISLSPYLGGKWINYSNLDLDDLSLPFANYKVKINKLKNLNINLKLEREEDKTLYYSGENIKELILVINKEAHFKKFDTENKSITTDIFKEIDQNEASTIINRVDGFISRTFNQNDNQNYLIPQLIYERNPFFALNDLPNFLAPFSKSFLSEISFLKSYLHLYLINNTQFDLRKNHWIIGGLQTYAIIKYIEEFYDEQKYLGRIADFKLIKAYNLSKIKFNESFLMYYELMEKTNLQQSDLIAKDKLVKFNERFGSPYHVGTGLRFLEEYMGAAFGIAIKDYFDKGGNDDLIQILKEYASKDIDWFYGFYLAKRTSIDIKIKSVKKNKDSLIVAIDKFSKNNVPFLLAQVKNDSIIDQNWIEDIESVGIVTLKNLEPDYVAINPEIRLPEKNKINNWKYVANPLNIKPLHFNFLKDYQSAKRTQLFYNPIASYNLYDGISVGSKFYDNGILKQKFNFELMPLYSTVKKTLVGKMSLSLLIHDEKRSNYASFLNFFGSSFHYDEDLRYQVISPSWTFMFRTKNFRRNERHAIGLYYYNVYREKPSETFTNPNYELFNLRYLFSNQGALKHTTFDSNFQFAGKFTKMELEFDFRRLLANGSQFTARLFAGKFLHHNYKQTNFFDFNLNRPQDYLFRYNYFGRSENQGFYSQQIVMAEGGFKSVHQNSTANDYLLSANITLGIWNWIEAYADVGTLKNKGESAHAYFGSGIRLNIIPDYLELFFPIYSSNGWEIDETPYENKIRFVLILNNKQLLGLFSRRWF